MFRFSEIQKNAVTNTFVHIQPFDDAKFGATNPYLPLASSFSEMSDFETRCKRTEHVLRDHSMSLKQFRQHNDLARSGTASTCGYANNKMLVHNL